MAVTLKIDPQKLESTSAEFDNQGNRVRGLLQNMMSIVTAMSGVVWQGEAQQAYVNKFKNLQGDMNQIFQKIHEHATDLKEIVRNYKTTEQQNQTSFGSLKNDYISG